MLHNIMRDFVLCNIVTFYISAELRASLCKKKYMGMLLHFCTLIIKMQI